MFYDDTRLAAYYTKKGQQMLLRPATAFVRLKGHYENGMQYHVTPCTISNACIFSAASFATHILATMDRCN